MKRTFILGAVLALALVVLAACGQNGGNSAMNHNGITMNHNSSNMNGMNHNSMPANSNHNMNMSGMKSDPNAARAPFDLQFIDTMSDHHRGAIEMAEMS